MAWQSHTFVKSLIHLQTMASVDKMRFVEKRHHFISSRGIFFTLNDALFYITCLWRGISCFLCICLCLSIYICLCLSINLFLVCLSLSASSASDFASRDPCAVHFLCPVSDFRSKCIPRSFSAAPTASTSLNLIQMHGSSGLTSVQGRGVGGAVQGKCKLQCIMCNIAVCKVQGRGVGGADHETHPMSFDPKPTLNFSNRLKLFASFALLEL